MLRISKLTDYGTVVLAHLAGDPETVCSAADVSTATGIAPPTVSKLLKSLARADLVSSTRGANGGYQLTRKPGEIRNLPYRWRREDYKSILAERHG